MLYNYFHVALRNLLKNRVHSVINVMGLALGMASVFLITLYISHELSFDTFHHDADDLYRITWMDNNPQTRTPHPMAQALAADFPEVESAVSLTPLWGAGLTRETHSFHIPSSDKRYDEMNILAVDTTFFKVFDFPLIKGDPKTALKSINGLLISESMARKYFRDEDPMGKQVAVDSANYLVEVVGVFKDVPANSHFHFDFLISYLREKSFDPDDSYYGWTDFGHYNYVRLRPQTDAAALESKLMKWSQKYLDWSDQDYASLADRHYGFRLQPVKEIHLQSKLHWELEPNGTLEYMYILGAAALFTLLIACVNFMNLTTAKSAERAKEIGVRKTMGAFRYQLSAQFLTESICTALVAVGISILIIEISLPFFSYLTGNVMNIHYPSYLTAAVGAALVIGALSGIYPALYLSGVRPHVVLKGKLFQSPKGSRFRKGLIVLQFGISMVLISSTVIIFNQLSFLQHKDLGFGREEVIVIPVKKSEGMYHFDALRNELLRVDGVKAVSASSNIPGHQFNQHGIAMNKRPDDAINSSEAFVDYDFFTTMGIELKDGRTFLRENPSDNEVFVLNETAARQLDASKNVIGRELLWHNDEVIVRGTIVGIVKDFHFQSLHEPIRPLMFKLSRTAYSFIVIKVDINGFGNRIKDIERVYKQFETTFGFEFSFLEEQLNKQYQTERQTGAMLAIFSGLALLIASFGLFGMSMMLFYQKAKEVSIRKVLGATPSALLVLMLGDFTKLVLFAIAIGIPLSWLMMTEWLKNFSYRVGINPLIFLFSGLLLVVIAWVTLGYFTVKATQLNPAETLKND
ncbi:MAG TPA: ABC transporter permease [Chryseolinea sp.]|nr:ABC transporter permease [Chryseolinea sp.]